MLVRINKTTVGQWLENTYLLHNEVEGWIIDPGDDFELIDASIQQEKINLKGIINTHGHFDHLGAVSDFKEKYKIPFFIHAEDKRLVGQANLYRKLANGNGFFKTPTIDHFLDPTITLILGPDKIRIIHIPGHTNGSVAFIIGNHLFPGDLIFENGVGRTDLPGGNPVLLKDSVKTILNNFNGYSVYPGHGESFTITETYKAFILSELDSWQLK